MKKVNRKKETSRLVKRFPDFESSWENLVRELGIDLVNSIKQRIQTEYAFLKELKNFKIKMIIDNNFILGQIKGAIKNKSKIEDSFLFKMLKSQSIEIFAPPLLQKELEEKIKVVIHQDDQDLAFSYSLLLLPRITIKDAQWIEDWKKANKLIGHIDKDDVPYLALAFEVGGHGILSYDEVFHQQGDIRVWQHKDADKVITNYNSGFISFVILDQAGQMLGQVLAVIYKFIRDLVKQLVSFIVALASGVITSLAQIPIPIFILLGALGIIFWDEIQAAGKEAWKYIAAKGNEILEKLKSVIRDIAEFLKKAIEIAKLGGVITLEFLAFLLDEYNGMNDQLDGLKFHLGFSDAPDQIVP